MPLMKAVQVSKPGGALELVERGGKLLIVGAAPDPLSVSPLQIILSRRSIQGWPSGTAKDSEDTDALIC